MMGGTLVAAQWNQQGTPMPSSTPRTRDPLWEMVPPPGGENPFLMRTEIFTLCDAATEQQGKLNLLGSFDHLFARQEPIAHPGCALALKLRFTKIEEGNHKIKITFGDEDGNLVMPAIEAPVAVFVPPTESTAVAHLILNIQQLKLPKFGEYSIDLAVDGRAETGLPLYVRKLPEPSKTTA